MSELQKTVTVAHKRRCTTTAKINPKGRKKKMKDILEPGEFEV